jgi:hypothetical protein
MITKEDMLMITQDAKTKDERYLSLAGNLDLENIPQMQGGETMH